MTELSHGISRRTVIKGIGAGTALAWTAPVISTLGMRASATSTMSFDLTADYKDAASGYVNPPWSYHFSDSTNPDVPVAPLAIYAQLPTIGPDPEFAFEGGNNPNADATFPFITKNNTGHDESFSDAPALVYKAGNVYGHPGNGTTDLLIQFTSPFPAGTTGTVTINATPIHSCTAGILVTVAGGTVSSGPTLVPFGSSFSFSQTGVALGPSTVIDLIVDSNGNYSCDSTLLGFTVTAA